MRGRACEMSRPGLLPTVAMEGVEQGLRPV